MSSDPPEAAPTPPDAEVTRVAALDLGSNSFHLLVADVGPDATVTPVLREKVMLRLGDTVARFGRIEPKADEVVQTLRRMRLMIDSVGADETVACATSAIRDAEDSRAIVSRIYSETGLKVRVITGLEEARLIFEAVRASLVLDPAPALCLDLGGGSLELNIGDIETLAWSTSLPLGVGRLTARTVQEDPPTKRDVKHLRAAINDELEKVRGEVEEHAPAMLVGTSGTLCDLAAIALHRRNGAVPRSLNQVVVSRGELVDVHTMLIGMTSRERADVPGLESRRAEVVVAGSTLILAVMDMFDMDEMTVGEWALREGMLLEAAARFESPDPRAIRRASVVDLCRRYGWPETHSRHVAALALSLFDQTHALHRLDDPARELLEYGALLHDIGEHVSAENHDRHTAYLIEHGRLRGFDPGEVAMLTCLGQYHRRGRPRDDFGAYASLRADRRRMVDILVGILRLAHGLDHGRTGMVGGVDLEIGAERVVVTVMTNKSSDADLEVWGAARAGKQFVRAFERELAFDVVPASEESVA